MRKNILVFLFCFSITAVNAQTEGLEKELIRKYQLPHNFFNASFGSKKYIQNKYDSHSRATGKTEIPPRELVSQAASILIAKKQLDKAYWLLRLNIFNYPNDADVYYQIASFHKIKKDEDRTYVNYLRGLTVKYKQIPVLPNSTYEIAREINNDYQDVFYKTGRKAVPPEYLIRTLAGKLWRANRRDDAFALYKMNYLNYPKSILAIEGMGSYHESMRDSLTAFRYYKEAALLEYKLPENFFEDVPDPIAYLKKHYSEQSAAPLNKKIPPEDVVNWLGYVFIYGKMIEKAGLLFKFNIENYPESGNVYNSMSDYYAVKGDKEKQEEYLKKEAEIKAKKTVSQKSNAIVEVLPDSTFVPQVTNPSCHNGCRTILFDEAHNNYHTSTRRYNPFTKLMEKDGFKVIRGQTAFTQDLLQQVNVVVIASPGFPSQIPIPVKEIEILNGWVHGGGSLLVITDHDNMAVDELLHSFGVETWEINGTTDSSHGRSLPNGTTAPANIYFSSKENSIGAHPITRGHNSSEKINYIETYGGRTVIGPKGSSPLLILSKTAIDHMVIDPEQRYITRVPVRSIGIRTHGLAHTFGKGKIVVMGEAAMMTAQMWPPDFASVPEGLNGPWDNKQFALNVMRWLTGFLK